MSRVLLQAGLYLLYAALNTAAMSAAKSAWPSLAAGRRFAAIRALALGGTVYIAVIGTLMVLLNLGQASVVLPIALGCTMVATNVVGVRLHGEQLSTRRIAGTALIAAGVALTFAGGGPS